MSTGTGIRAAAVAAVAALALAAGAGTAAADGSAFQRVGDARVDLTWTGTRAAPRAIALRVRVGPRPLVARGLQRGGWGIPPAGPIVGLRDLDGDGTLEATADLTSGGLRCCLRTHIVRWDADAGAHRRIVHDWRAGGYRLARLDRDRALEFVSADERLEFGAPPPAQLKPIRIWNYRDGAMHDVTASHRRAVAADLNHAWAMIGRLRRAGVDPRDAIAAYLADARLLGRADAARRRGRPRSRRAGPRRRAGGGRSSPTRG